MIVIRLEVHEQSVTAVAVDETGRPLAETTIRVGSEELVGWAAALDAERLWAVEDCRQLTRWLEQQLLSFDEELVRGARHPGRGVAPRVRLARELVKPPRSDPGVANG